MKKNVIVMAILLLLVAMSLIYALVQKAIADENIQLANIYRAEAEKKAKLADKLAIKLNECENAK